MGFKVKLFKTAHKLQDFLTYTSCNATVATNRLHKNAHEATRSCKW